MCFSAQRLPKTARRQRNPEGNPEQGRSGATNHHPSLPLVLFLLFFLSLLLVLFLLFFLSFPSGICCSIASDRQSPHQKLLSPQILDRIPQLRRLLKLKLLRRLAHLRLQPRQIPIQLFL